MMTGNRSTKAALTAWGSTGASQNGHGSCSSRWACRSQNADGSVCIN